MMSIDIECVFFDTNKHNDEIDIHYFVKANYKPSLSNLPAKDYDDVVNFSGTLGDVYFSIEGYKHWKPAKDDEIEILSVVCNVENFDNESQNTSEELDFYTVSKLHQDTIIELIRDKAKEKVMATKGQCLFDGE